VIPKDTPKDTPKETPKANPKEDPKKGGTTTPPKATDPKANTGPANPDKVGNPDTNTTAAKPMVPAETFAPVDPSKLRDPSNLLPGQSVSVIKVNMDRLRSTPMYSAFFDKSMLDFFLTMLTFEAADVESVHFCMCDADREPFVLIRTKKPFTSQITNKLDIELSSLPMAHGRKLFLIKQNGLVSSIGKVFNGDYIMGRDKALITDPAAAKAEAAKQMGMHIYDSQTLAIGDLNIVARWLGEMNKAGELPYQTEVAPPGGIAPPAGGAAPANPGGRGGKAGEPAPAPAPAADGSTPPGEKLFDSRGDYRTIRPDLKQMLNKCDYKDKSPPVLLWADMIEQRTFMDKRSEDDLGANDNIYYIIKELSRSIVIAGAGIQEFRRENIIGTLVVKCTSEEDAKNASEKRFKEFIERQLLGFFEGVLGTKIEGWTATNAGRGGAAGAGDTGGQDFTKSKLTLQHNDFYVTLDMDLKVAPENWNKLIQPYIVSQITQMKGRMAILSGETSWHSLSSRFARVVSERKEFPQGALPRNTTPARFGLPWPPEQRASFLVELLPYLNQGGLRSTIQDKKLAWYDKANIKAAQTWVPQFLVPYYPQSAWRAEHPAAHEERGGLIPLGATNFVGIAGLGLDAARYSPTNPEHAKLIGMTGYEWGSKPGEVTDGLSNTIYMLQVPPGFNRPWIAGGGATLMGVDDRASNPLLDFTSPDAAGKRGTYALMGDGAVRYLPENMDAKAFKAMVTRAGGETIDDMNGKYPKLPVPKSIEAELKGGSGSLLDLVMGTPKKNDRSKIDAPELQKMQGKWKVSFLFSQGKSVPSGQLDEMEMTLDIEDTRITNHVKDAPDTAMIIALLDPKATPKRIGRVPEGAKAMDPGIYSLDSDGKKLRIRFRKEPRNADDYPKELAVPQEGDTDTYIELTKIQG
jgi:uncharacterized protein (TIGR03067 family)